MPGNINNAALAVKLHDRDCRMSRSGQPWDRKRPRLLGAGSYRCAYLIKGCVYKVEHPWENEGNCNETEYLNSLTARKERVTVVPTITQFMVRHRKGIVSVNAMRYYPDKPKKASWYDDFYQAIKDTSLYHLTWDLGLNNVRCTPSGQLRLIDAADMCSNGYSDDYTASTY